MFVINKLQHEEKKLFKCSLFFQLNLSFKTKLNRVCIELERECMGENNEFMIFNGNKI